MGRIKPKEQINIQFRGVNMDEIIYNFCKNAEHIYYGTSVVDSLKDLRMELDFGKNEVYRSRRGNDDTHIFDMKMDVGVQGSLLDEVKCMKTIELFYPNTFSWRFDGEHIQAIALIQMSKENLGIFGRYNGVNSFIKYLRRQLINVLKYRDLSQVNYTDVIEDKILSTGSINSKTNSYVIDILVNDDPQIYIPWASATRRIRNPVLKTLNMKFWVREINPDYYKEVPVKKSKKYALTNDVWDKYPVCIKRIAALPKKGNYNRFLLATFLLGVHNERDAKHQLDLMLSDEERIHMNSGNCKDQWRAIVAKGYSPPSVKTMLELGFAKTPADCIGLRIIEEDKEETGEGEDD